MYRDFIGAVLEDLNGDDTTVTIDTDQDGKHIVVLATRANLFPHTTGWLDTVAARAIASALLEAADEADARQLEDETRQAEHEDRIARLEAILEAGTPIPATVATCGVIGRLEPSGHLTSCALGPHSDEVDHVDVNGRIFDDERRYQDTGTEASPEIVPGF